LSGVLSLAIAPWQSEIEITRTLGVVIQSWQDAEGSVRAIIGTSDEKLLNEVIAPERS
jgi:hypothetical protein